MDGKTQIAAVLVAGYLLGRTKKMKLALTVAGAIGGRQILHHRGELISKAAKMLESSPEARSIVKQVRTTLLEAATGAAVTAASRGIGSLSDSLQDRAEKLREPKPEDDEPQDDEPQDEREEPEDDEPEDEREEPEDSDTADDGDKKPSRRQSRPSQSRSGQSRSTQSRSKASGSEQSGSKQGGSASGSRGGSRTASSTRRSSGRSQSSSKSTKSSSA